MGQIPNSVIWERHIEPISMLLGHGVEDMDHILHDRRVVAFSPVKEGILPTGLGYKMIGASDSCCSDILADEPGIDVMFVQFDHDGIDVPMLSRVSASEEAHDVGCMHFIMEKS